MKIMVINGPNLNMLGIRNKSVYGAVTLDEINQTLRSRAEGYGCDIDFFQSNSEGAIIDTLHSCYGKYYGIIINAGAYTHTSYAIRDAIEAINLPTVEVHLSNIHAREQFRRVSVIAPVCKGSIAGFGATSYTLALDALIAEM